MKEVERRSEDFHEEAELPRNLKSHSGSLYDVLIQYHNGEALSVVRSMEDTQGIQAWRNLSRKSNSKTIARSLRLMHEAKRSTPVEDLRCTEKAINQWGEKVKALKNQFNKDLSIGLTIEIPTCVLPPTLQEDVYTHITGEM